jgi:hypothetical protein
LGGALSVTGNAGPGAAIRVELAIDRVGDGQSTDAPPWPATANRPLSGRGDGVAGKKGHQGLADPARGRGRRRRCGHRPARHAWGAMARTRSKGPALGKLPPCLICAGPGEGPRAQLHMTHGVTVWLCEGHRTPAFLIRRAGRDLAASLGALWSGAGCFTAPPAQGARRSPAAGAPAAGGCARPGSYAWPELRREAERRFAAGEPPARVIGELRDRYRQAPARLPPIRTMRRRFNDGRWLPRGRPQEAGTDPPATRRARANTASIMGGVRRPVKVFCWLGW